jgi:hypothetical protein
MWFLSLITMTVAILYVDYQFNAYKRKLTEYIDKKFPDQPQQPVKGKRAA